MAQVEGIDGHEACPSGVSALAQHDWFEEPKSIEWLRYANAGMLMRDNVVAIAHAVENLPSDSPVVEIGSFCGLSTNIIDFYLCYHQRSNRIFASDKWTFEGVEV